jgi:hypothetical protein
MNNETKNKIKNILNSKIPKYILYTLGILIAIFLILQVGIFVGFHKASFGRDWGDNYINNFGPNRHNGLPIINDNFINFPNSNGAVGKIIKIQLPSIIVSDKDGTEKVIIINNDTNIRLTRDDIKPSDLKVNDFIVVIGSPNSKGEIEAKLIRLLPLPPPDISLQGQPLIQTQKK